MFGFNRLVKAFEDKILASLIILVTSPVMLLIALGIKLTSPGPILFKQKRHGWNGELIEVWKFRTMRVHQEPKGVVTQASYADSRITAFGSFLRGTSLDELPQFFNVLQGRMSVVGPRPHAIEHNELYKDLVPRYMQRHRVKPGITGWAQISGWRGQTDTLEKMERRIEHDLYYIQNWSLWLDLKIILLTIFKGFINSEFASFLHRPNKPVSGQDAALSFQNTAPGAAVTSFKEETLGVIAKYKHLVASRSITAPSSVVSSSNSRPLGLTPQNPTAPLHVEPKESEKFQEVAR